MASLFSLRKSKHVLRHSYHLFRRKSKNLNMETKEHLRATLQALQEAILQKNREKADLFAKETLSLTALHLKKNAFDQFRELIIAVVFALTVAVLVRQMWFEPYEIPTG